MKLQIETQKVDWRTIRLCRTIRNFVSGDIGERHLSKAVKIKQKESKIVPEFLPIEATFHRPDRLA